MSHGFCIHTATVSTGALKTGHYILDWNFDEARCRISKGYGPENITRLRRFAIGLLKSKGVHNVTQKMRQFSLSPRLVLDYLKMTGDNHSSGYVSGVA